LIEENSQADSENSHEVTEAVDSTPVACVAPICAAGKVDFLVVGFDRGTRSGDHVGPDRCQAVLPSQGTFVQVAARYRVRFAVRIPQTGANVTFQAFPFWNGNKDNKKRNKYK